MIAIQTINSEKIHYVIGVYLKESEKLKILDTLWTLIKRIRKNYINPVITVFEDFNTNKRDFKIEMIEIKTGLKATETNKNATTRIQNMGEINVTSTLD